MTAVTTRALTSDETQQYLAGQEGWRYEGAEETEHGVQIPAPRYPHQWGRERCQRDGCDVMGTGDWENDGDCTKHPDYRAIYYTGDLIESDDTDTNVYGEPTEPGHGEVMTSGWVDPDWSTWTVYEDRDHVRPDVYEPDEYDIEDGITPAKWLAEQVTKRLGGIDTPDGSDWFRAADAHTHGYDGKSITLAAHPEGFTTDEIDEAVRLMTERK